MTKSFVVVIIGNSKSNHLGVQGTFKATVQESIIHALPPPHCIAHIIAMLLHGHCAMYDPPPAPPFRLPYMIQYC